MTEDRATRAPHAPTAPQGPAPASGADPAPGRASQGDTGLRDPHDPLLPDAERIAETRRRNARAAFEPDLRRLIQINIEDVPLLLYAVEQLSKRAEEAEAAVERARPLLDKAINSSWPGTPEGDAVREARAALEPKETPQ